MVRMLIGLVGKWRQRRVIPAIRGRLRVTDQRNGTEFVANDWLRRGRGYWRRGLLSRTCRRAISLVEVSESEGYSWVDLPSGSTVPHGDQVSEMTVRKLGLSAIPPTHR